MTTTEQKRANLKALADYLDTGITEYEFGMAQFWEEHECGTVACAVGHAPFVLGLPVPVAPLARSAKNWAVFAEDRLLPSGYIEDCEFDWMFGEFWVRTDNTARGAAARIYWYLEHGVPDDWHGQMFGDAPLCYTVKPLPEITPAKEAVG